jgi:hypothetical protein
VGCRVLGMFGLVMVLAWLGGGWRAGFFFIVDGEGDALDWVSVILLGC